MVQSGRGVSQMSSFVELSWVVWKVLILPKAIAEIERSPAIRHTKPWYARTVEAFFQILYCANTRKAIPAAWALLIAGGFNRLPRTQRAPISVSECGDVSA